MSASAIIKFVRKQLLLQVLRGTADANIRFDDLRSLLTALGFVERVKGSHHIFSKPDVVGILNLQTTRLVGEAIPGQASSRSDRSV